jgi:hypothetical protein
MGCDIHLHVEIKISGVWHHYSCPHVNRNYELFERMAGVRGKLIYAISPPKGLPSDISIVTALESEGYGHSHSWLGAEEISRLDDGKYGDMEYDILHSYLFGNSFSGFWRYPNDRPAGIEDLRFVFWFDS